MLWGLITAMLLCFEPIHHAESIIVLLLALICLKPCLKHVVMQILKASSAIPKLFMEPSWVGLLTMTYGRMTVQMSTMRLLCL